MRPSQTDLLRPHFLWVDFSNSNNTVSVAPVAQTLHFLLLNGVHQLHANIYQDTRLENFFAFNFDVSCNSLYSVN